MLSQSHRAIKTGSSVDLAFAVVVLASYFAIFSSMKQADAMQIGLMAGFGIAYVAIGIYGYKFASRSSALLVQLAYFVIQIPVGAAIIYLSAGAGFNALILLPLAGHSVVMLPQVWLYLTNTIVVLAYILSVAAYSGGWASAWTELPTFLAGVIFIMVFTQMAVSEEKARMEVERLARDLEDANRRLLEHNLQVEELTIVRERNRMAREIHDGLGHYLTTINMQIQAAVAVMKKDPQRAQEALEKSQGLVQQALVDVRRSVAALHSLTEESMPLSESIARMLVNCDPLGIQHDFKVIGNPRELSPQTQLTLYRAAQESINNTCKHSHASKISVRLDYSMEGKIRLSVDDNGIGSDDPKGGFGLMGLRERAVILSGDLHIHSAHGQGFHLEMTVPG